MTAEPPKKKGDPSRAECRQLYLAQAAAARENKAPIGVLEAAAWKRVTPRTIRQMIADGRLAAERDVGGWTIRWEDLDPTS